MAHSLKNAKKNTGEERLAIALQITSLLAAAEIKSHISLSFDHFFPSEIDLSSITQVSNALIYGVTTTLLQMKNDRWGLLPLK
jgi:hypothetical protein